MNSKVSVQSFGRRIRSVYKASKMPLDDLVIELGWKNRASLYKLWKNETKKLKKKYIDNLTRLERVYFPGDTPSSVKVKPSESVQSNEILDETQEMLTHLVSMFFSLSLDDRRKLILDVAVKVKEKRDSVPNVVLNKYRTKKR